MSEFESGADFLRHVRENGGKASGGPREQVWSAGWAIIPFATLRDARVHWWHRTNSELGVRHFVWLDAWSSLCGRVNAMTFHATDGRTITPLDPGNFPRCSFCARAVSARLRTSLGLPIGKPHAMRAA